MKHSTASLGARHPIHDFEYADAVTRLAATGFVAADLGKCAWQLDDDTFWILTDDVAPAWTAFNSGLINPMTTLGDLIVGGASGSPARLALGAALSFLRVNAAGVAIEWASNWVAAPATAASTGTAGQKAYDTDGFLYICIATNTWVRFAGASWS